MTINPDAIMIIEKGFQSAFVDAFPTYSTAWPNAPWTDPGVRVPYAKVSFIYDDTEDLTVGAGVARDGGILQFDLKYPVGKGEAPLLTMFGQIRNVFFRGFSFSENGVMTMVHRTPRLGPVLDDAARYVRPVRVPFFSNVS